MIFTIVKTVSIYQIYSLFRTHYFNFVTHPIMKWVILGFFSCVIGVFIYFASTLKVNEEQVRFVIFYYYIFIMIFFNLHIDAKVFQWYTETFNHFIPEYVHLLDCTQLIFLLFTEKITDKECILIINSCSYLAIYYITHFLYSEIMVYLIKNQYAQS